MSMQHRVVHTTGYQYDGKAVASYNQARLTPVSSTDQIVVHTRLEVTPHPWTFEYRDYFGSQVTAFEVVDPHDTLRVTATSTVQVDRPPRGEPTSTWEQLGQREVADRWVEYLVLPELVAPASDFARRARAVAQDAARPGDAAHALCQLVSEEVEYVEGSTDAHTTAARAWQQRAGVCQDMAHLVIGGLRTMGVPARYVSGYYHPAPDPEIGSRVASGSHAWVEWWDERWHGLDITNGNEPDDRYVTIATGRDYADVKPLAGIYSGAETSQMFVDVEITRLF